MSKLLKHFLSLTPEKFWGRHAERQRWELEMRWEMHGPMHRRFSVHHVKRAGTRQRFAQITLQQELGNTYLDTQPSIPWMENDSEYVLLIMVTIT